VSHIRDFWEQCNVWGAREPDRAAEDNLRNWRAVSRDNAVREAAAAGLSVARIQKLTGLATTTIMRILNQPPKPQACPPDPGRGSRRLTAHRRQRG
jgi:hypothetical protein